MSGRRGESVTLNGIGIGSANQIEGLEISDDSPLENQSLAWSIDDDELVWRNTRSIFGGSDSATSTFDDVIGGATAATTTFRATIYGGNAKTI